MAMDYRRRWNNETKREEMRTRITKKVYSLKPRMTLKKRTFWDWLTRKPLTYVHDGHHTSCVEYIEQESLTRLLENIASSQTRGQSCHCNLNDGKKSFNFTVDKGRNRLAIQCSGNDEMDTRKTLDLFLNLLEKDKRGIPFDISDKNGKCYRIVFNFVNREMHSLLNRMKDTGG